MCGWGAGDPRAPQTRSTATRGAAAAGHATGATHTYALARHCRAPPHTCPADLLLPSLPPPTPQVVAMDKMNMQWQLAELVLLRQRVAAYSADNAAMSFRIKELVEVRGGRAWLLQLAAHMASVCPPAASCCAASACVGQRTASSSGLLLTCCGSAVTPAWCASTGKEPGWRPGAGAHGGRGGAQGGG